MPIAPERAAGAAEHCCAYHADNGQGCQYASRECDLVELNGRHWCYFHLPAQDADGVASPKGSWDAHTLEAFNQSIFKLIDTARTAGSRVDLTGVVFPADISFRRYDADRSLPDISFNRAQFLGTVEFDEVHFNEVDFRECGFRAPVTFHGAHLNRAANFAHTAFYQEAWFKHVDFQGDANFTAAVFHADCGFTESHFGGRALFNDVVFDHYAGFNNVIFAREAGFDHVLFRSFAGFVDSRLQDDATFAGTVFTGHSAFSKAIFNKNVTFADANFGRDARFDQAQFAGVARFERVTFGRDGIFFGAKFNRDARFNGGTFRGTAEFSRSKFTRDAGFSDVRFEEELRCERGIFHGHAGFVSADFCRADFSGAKFRSDALFFCSPNYAQRSAEEDDYDDEEPPKVNFQQAKFAGRAMFANRRFVYPASFENAEFKIAPDFYGSALQQGTTFNGCIFLDRGAGNERAAWSYHTLKLLMEAVGDRANAGLFFTYEQEAMSNTHRSWTIMKALPKLYEITSCNGQSVLRPLLWLMGTSVLAFFVYLYHLHGLQPASVTRLSWDGFAELARLTTLPIVAPFWAVSAHCEDCSRGLKVMMSFQSVISLTWIGLALMALRRYFQKEASQADIRSGSAENGMPDA